MVDATTHKDVDDLCPIESKDDRGKYVDLDKGKDILAVRSLYSRSLHL